MLIGSSLSSCSPADETTIFLERFGLETTTDEQPMVVQAALLANAVLSTIPGAGSFEVQGISHGSEGAVPILLLSGRNLAPELDVIRAPPECRCVLIQARAIRSWLDKALDGDGYGDPFDEAHVLAFMLLHEMGHNTIGETIGGQRADLVPAMEKEVQADAFALAAVKRALISSKPSEAKTIVANMAVLANNLYLESALGGGLAELLCLEPTMYWDMGTSHPNLVLRMIKAADELAPSLDSTIRLKDFTECRSRSPEHFDLFD